MSGVKQENQNDDQSLYSKMLERLKSATPSESDKAQFTGELQLNEGLEKIGACAFRGCTSLKSVVLPEGLTKIGVGVFHSCTSLRSVVLPEGLTEIGAGAFRGCRSLKSVALPKGLTKIGVGAFSHCEGLDSVVLPEGLTKIGGGAFDDCPVLRVIGIDTTDPNEFARIVALLPELLRNKVLPMTEMKRLKGIKNAAVENLFHTKEVSKLCLSEQLEDIPKLNKDVHRLIASYHPVDNPYVQSLQAQIDQLPLPRSENEYQEYKDRVSVIKESVAKEAKDDHKETYSRVLAKAKSETLADLTKNDTAESSERDKFGFFQSGQKKDNKNNNNDVSAQDNSDLANGLVHKNVPIKR